MHFKHRDNLENFQKVEGERKTEGKYSQLKGKLLDKKDNFKLHLLVESRLTTQNNKHKWKHVSTSS